MKRAIITVGVLNLLMALVVSNVAYAGSYEKYMKKADKHYEEYLDELEEGDYDDAQEELEKYEKYLAKAERYRRHRGGGFWCGHCSDYFNSVHYYCGKDERCFSKPHRHEIVRLRYYCSHCRNSFSERHYYCVYCKTCSTTAHRHSQRRRNYCSSCQKWSWSESHNCDGGYSYRDTYSWRGRYSRSTRSGVRGCVDYDDNDYFRIGTFLRFSW